MSAPALPRRVPGAALAASAAEDCSADSDVCSACNGVHPGGAGGAFCEAAGDVFIPTRPVTEAPVCFECNRRPASLLITTAYPTATGGLVSQTFQVCDLDAGPVATSLPDDVDVVILRIRKDPS